MTDPYDLPAPDLLTAQLESTPLVKELRYALAAAREREAMLVGVLKDIKWRFANKDSESEYVPIVTARQLDRIAQALAATPEDIRLRADVVEMVSKAHAHWPFLAAQPPHGFWDDMEQVWAAVAALLAHQRGKERK